MPTPPRFFERHPDYSQLLSGAHRKPATSVGTPALICHLAFWQPDKLAEGQTSGATSDHNQDSSASANWIANIDAYLRYLYCLLLDYSVTSPNTDASKFENSNFLFLLSHAIDLKSPTRDLIDVNALKIRAPGTDRYFDKSYRSIVFEFVWHHLPVKLRIEKHKEYLQITSFIDLSEVTTRTEAVGTAPVRKSSNKDDIYSAIYIKLETLDSLLFVRKQRLAEEKSRYRKVENDEKERADFRGIHSYLYQDIWMQFVGEVLNSERAIRSTKKGIDIPGSVSERYKGSAGQPRIGKVFADFRGLIFNEPHPDETIANGKFLQLPGWHLSTLRSSAVPIEGMKSAHCAELTYTLWPLLTIEERVDLKKYEFTVSRMLGSRALYITALGAQPSPYLDSSAMPGDDRQLPVFYLAYFRTFNRWQIGRLVDRINHLGTVRIAAIQQSEKLREKSDELQSLSIDESLGTSTDNESQKTLFAKMVSAQATMAKWAREDFPGGIEYRIERSRYYVKQFRDGVPALRIKRVGGYQPYDVFVEHRLGAVFDFIHTFGLRLQRFENRFNVLYQFLLVGKSAEHSRQITILQTAAEAFFVGLAAPYYLMGAAHFAIPKEYVESIPGVVAQGLVWLAFLCFGAKRFKEFIKLKRSSE